MTKEERYRYFPKKLLDERFPEKGKDSLSVPRISYVGLKPRRSSRSILNFGLDSTSSKISISYPSLKNSYSECHINIAVPDGFSSDLQIWHMPSKGKGRVCCNITLGKESKLSVTEVVITGSAVLSEMKYSLEKDSTLKVCTADIRNSILSRSQVFELNEDGASVTVNGVFMVAEGENVENYILMDHNASHTESHQSYRGISGGLASFLGHIRIKQDSQKCTAMQNVKNIITNDEGKVYARPWLEIYADDVKCNHGATVGTADDDAMFYMCQRGIPKDAARAVLLEGFVSEVLDGIASGIKQRCRNRLKSI